VAVDYDKLMDKWFLRQPDGRSIFHPWGIFGYGYWVDTPAREQSMRQGIRRRLKIFRILTPVLLVAGFLGTDNPLFPQSVVWSLLVLAWGAVFFWWGRNLTRGLERAPRIPRIKAAPSGGKLSRYLDRQAVGRSFTALLVQTIVLGPVALYATRDLLRAWPPTALGVIATLILWPLVLITVAALVTKIRKRGTLGGPSPEQQYASSVFRPMWLLAAALPLFVLLHIFWQIFWHADHSRPAPSATSAGEAIRH
jgi:hypothetical protein